MTESNIKLVSSTILGIKSMWNREMIEPKSSSKPLLQYVSRETSIGYSFFMANTREELRFIFSKMIKKNSGILYLASHGNKNIFFFGAGNADYVSLHELGDLLHNKLKGKAIHLSSCETLNIPESEILRFKGDTGATLVSGYTKSVDWMEFWCTRYFVSSGISTT